MDGLSEVVAVGIVCVFNLESFLLKNNFSWFHKSLEK